MAVMGRERRPTQRADSSHSPQSRASLVFMIKADVQKVPFSSAALHRRKAALSPLYQMPSRSILRVQQNHPDMDGPYQPSAQIVLAASQPVEADAR
jgi:hypothetical protein